MFFFIYFWFANLSCYYILPQVLIACRVYVFLNDFYSPLAAVIHHIHPGYELSSILMKGSWASLQPFCSAKWLHPTLLLKKWTKTLDWLNLRDLLSARGTRSQEIPHCRLLEPDTITASSPCFSLLTLSSRSSSTIDSMHNAHSLRCTSQVWRY